MCSIIVMATNHSSEHPNITYPDIQLQLLFFPECANEVSSNLSLVLVFKLYLLCAVLVGSAEAADQLGTNGKLVERLVEWCEAKDHAGVMGESNRLLSALIRHSKSKVRCQASNSECWEWSSEAVF